MLVVFSPIFVADTKIIFRYDFVAPLISLYCIMLRVAQDGIFFKIKTRYPSVLLFFLVSNVKRIIPSRKTVI